LGTINNIILVRAACSFLLAACTSEARRRAPSWRKLEIHALELDPSSHFRPRRHSVGLLPFLPCPIQFVLWLSPSRDRGNDYTPYTSRHACLRFDLTYRCCSTRPVTLTRTLESHMEPTRGTALSILTSIGSDMHECRLACQTHVYAPYTLVSWASIEPIQTFHLVSPNTRADFAANHH
jgi:hypothetical protein